jgi:sugar phosphate permease
MIKTPPVTPASAPASALEPLPLQYASPIDITRLYTYWRFRILAITIVGYALFYFVRVNINVPLKSIGADLGYSKERLGIIISVGGVVYGISKFFNGFLGDHANPRYFMAIGLLGSAAMNVCFGSSSALLFLGVFWFFNNWTQGMGFPPCAKSMAHWFTPRERASVFGIWHISHMIGAALVSALTGYLVVHFGWRSCFYVPAVLAVVGAVLIYLYLRDTPESMGLPPVEVYKGEETRTELAQEIKIQESYFRVVVEYILKSPYMWVISCANFTVYFLRYVQLTWGPTFLQESKGMSVIASGWLSFGSEIAGMSGALIAGFLADRVFGGRAGRVCVLSMLLMSGAIYGFWSAPGGGSMVAGGFFILMGFLLYVPQMLIAAMAMNLGTKRAAAAAVGLTGFIGYLSMVVAGWGVGRVADYYGWAGAFAMMLACTFATVVLMAFTWNVGAHRTEVPE